MKINEWRAIANSESFIHLGKEFACDSLSRSDIDGTSNCILLTGDFPQPWPQGWKAIDNSYISIKTIDEWKLFIRSMSNKGSSNFAKAQLLKTKVDLAKTQEDLDMIVW